MAELSVLFEVPQSISDGIKQGDFKLFGGVVRDTAGKIVCHLKEATTLDSASIKQFAQATNADAKGTKVVNAATSLIKPLKSMVNQIGSFVGDHPVIAAVGCVAIVGGPWLGVKWWQKHQIKKLANITNQFQRALKQYIIHAQDRTLSVKDISDLKEATERLIAFSRRYGVPIELDAGVLRDLINYIVDSTKKLAVQNGLNYSDVRNAFGGLRSMYWNLELQEEIIRAA